MAFEALFGSFYLPEMNRIKENVQKLEVKNSEYRKELADLKANAKYFAIKNFGLVIENLEYQDELEDAKQTIEKLKDDLKRKSAAAEFLEEEEEKKKELGGISINGKDYIFNKKLAEGAFGKVYFAKERSTGKEFAVKYVDKSNFKNAKCYDGELNNLKTLDHPNIIKFYGSVETWGSGVKHSVYFVLEYAAGGDLCTYIYKNDISEAKAKNLFRQIISGVEYMHSKKIAHYDLKTENILLDSKGKIKIAVFGLSKEMKKNAQMESRCGTPKYSAFEIFDSSDEYDGMEADMYSLGIILHELVTKFSKTIKSSQCHLLYKKLTSKEPSARPTASEVLQDKWLA